jgi:hypothetical protein
MIIDYTSIHLGREQYTAILPREGSMGVPFEFEMYIYMPTKIPVPNAPPHNLPTEFFTTFWNLNLYNIFFPAALYDKEIARLTEISGETESLEAEKEKFREKQGRTITQIPLIAVDSFGFIQHCL